MTTTTPSATCHENGGCLFTTMKTPPLSKALNTTSWVIRIAAAIILFQTLFFKFTGAPESVYIFTTVGLEPWGRYGSGFVELIASMLLIFPRVAWFGAFLSVGVMGGAIMSHLTKLGIVVQNDGGELFALACIVMVCSLATLWIYRREIPVIGGKF